MSFYFLHPIKSPHSTPLSRSALITCWLPLTDSPKDRREKQQRQHKDDNKGYDWQISQVEAME